MMMRVLYKASNFVAMSTTGYAYGKLAVCLSFSFFTIDSTLNR
ncbi:hypothetical protein COO91_02881 [Nostoc flagelliforme CCNUN1]|uniref:Uncharacterized protein n=1 Tax=Nostoc flagelliforme CCNUN1 TaxID=2038116 RepID=A0A2K8SNC3_9NOSO|nr:hypothetical protein COO91_02881 [Nostoc flagelliforme CCNUN1]